GWDPSLWASRKPLGIGERRPNDYLEIFRALIDNRDNLAHAWRILNHGACNGCTLGPIGMRDWTLDETQLCNVRPIRGHSGGARSTLQQLDPDNRERTTTLNERAKQPKRGKHVL